MSVLLVISIFGDVLLTHLNMEVCWWCVKLSMMVCLAVLLILILGSFKLFEILINFCILFLCFTGPTVACMIMWFSCFHNRHVCKGYKQFSGSITVTDSYSCVCQSITYFAPCISEWYCSLFIKKNNTTFPFFSYSLIQIYFIKLNLNFTFYKYVLT